VKAVLDTDILVDYLCGVVGAREELAHYAAPVISLVTWVELLIGARTPDEEQQLRGFLKRFEVQPLTTPIAERAVAVRREHRLRLPDAIIWATAQELNVLLVTRNARDFPVGHPGVRIPYRRRVPSLLTPAAFPARRSLCPNGLGGSGAAAGAPATAGS
jgi:predicted nucleic acid-binding protein